MEPRDADRLLTLAKEAALLAATLILAPLKQLLRQVIVGVAPVGERRWPPVDDGPPVVGDAATASADSAVAVPPSPHRADFTGADAARLREAEREAEFTGDGPGPEWHVEEPWPGYDAMTVGDVLERLTGANATLRAMVRLYEETHKNRKGVLRATE